jgi:hypothetical protein
VLFGDSHAQHWFPAVERLAAEVDARFVSLTKSACPSVAVSVYLKSMKRMYHECDAWRAAMLSRIVAMRPVMVIVSNGGWYTEIAAEGRLIQIPPDAWRRGLDGLIAPLNDARIPVFVIHDTPFPGMDIPGCLARAAWRHATGAGACAFSLTRDHAISAAEDQSVAAQGDAFAMDFTGVICPRTPCETERDGYVLYRDESHLTVRFSRSLGVPLLRAVKDYAARRPTSRVSELFVGGD